MLPAQEAEIPLPRLVKTGPRAGLMAFWIAVSFLILCFGRVLFDLAAYASKESLHSHILLVPFVSGYLVWIVRRSLPVAQKGGLLLPLLLAFGALLTLGVYHWQRFEGDEFSRNDTLSFNVFSFWLLFLAAAVYFLGGSFTRRIAFPLFFLIFLVPLPDKLTNALEIASQYASAETYSWFMDLSGATYYRDGRTFLLPNLPIVVAQECSGIRSSLVLFITSLIAGQLFLHSTWKKLLLACAVFPLGILRNAFRIYLLSMVSAHTNLDVINSPLHHRGGPVFFVLSLIPFFLFLFWLRKSERKTSTPAHAGALA
jgi:exosortase C (VPDSG-CTERM-specific)